VWAPGRTAVRPYSNEADNCNILSIVDHRGFCNKPQNPGHTTANGNGVAIDGIMDDGMYCYKWIDLPTREIPTR